MHFNLHAVFTENLPSRRGALTFFWIAIACVLTGVASIGSAEAFMPDNMHGQQAVLTFYRAFGPMILLWSIGAACSQWYLLYLAKKEQLVRTATPSHQG